MLENSTVTPSAKSTLEISPTVTYDLLQWALSYARAGVAVFPLYTPIDGKCDCGDEKCGSPGKHPRNPHGVSEATTDEKRIREWWTKWPTANIGGRTTGLESRDTNFFTTVIDIDPRHGGETTYQELVQEIGLPPYSPVHSRTGTGEHAWFRVTVACGGSSNTLGPGVDTRAKGNYVVLPPSTHYNGQRYTWVNEAGSPVDALPDFTQIPLADDWLAQARAHAGRKEVTAEVGNAKLLEDGQGRNTLLFAHLDRYCRDEKQGRVTKKMLRAIAAAWDADNCKSSLGEKELNTIADSVFKRYQDRKAGKEVLAPTKPSVVWMDTVTPRRLDYLTYPYLPLGVLSLMAGDAGEGKSMITLDWAAAATNGVVPMSTSNELLRDGPGNVLVMGMEDALDCTVYPRLQAAGADLRRVAYLRGATTVTDDGEKLIDVSLLDIGIIEETVREVKPILMVIDPVTDYLGKTDMHRANEVGPILKRLEDLAQRYNCAVLLIAHLSKGDQSRPMHKVLGSIAFVTKVRSQMLAGHGPDDPSYHALIHTKANNTPTGTSVGYRIVVANPDDPKEQHLCRVQWTGPSPLRAEDLVAPQQVKARESKALQAENFLRGFLSSGPRTVLEVEQAAMRKGISLKTLENARAVEGVISSPAGFGKGRVLRLPTPEEQAEQQAEF